MELEIPEIQQILSEIKELKKEIHSGSNQSELESEWYNDEQCWKARGGCSLNTYRTNRFYQCKGGIPDGYVGGRKAWKRSSVQEWKILSDDQLEDYHKKYKTGAVKRVG